MIKYIVFIITALTSLFALANTTKNFDEQALDVGALSSVPENKFYLKYVDIDSGRWVSNPLNIDIDTVLEGDLDKYSITKGEIFQSAQNGNKSGQYISVFAKRKGSTITINWLDSAMKNLSLYKTDIVNTNPDRPDDVKSFPKELDYVFQTTLYIHPPKANESYRCDDVIIAEDSNGIWWMTGNTPNPLVYLTDVQPYERLPVLECESTKEGSYSTLKAYIGATLGSVGKNKMILNYKIRN